MTEPQDTWDPPQDTGAPDTTETDAAALNSAEDLDEDRLRADPLDEGMDPPEHWSGVDKYGMTPREERNPRPLGERLDEEQPDIPDPAVEHRPAESDAISVTGGPGEIPPAPDEYEEELGIEADIAGGSMADEIREPEPQE